MNPRCLIIPSIEDLLAEQHPHFLYEKSFEVGRLDPLFVMYVSIVVMYIQFSTKCYDPTLTCSFFLLDRHTSGSTGMPKPLIWTQESAARQHLCSSQEYSKFDGTSIESIIWGKRVMSTVPPFHVSTSHEIPQIIGIV